MEDKLKINRTFSKSFLPDSLPEVTQTNKYQKDFEPTEEQGIKQLFREKDFVSTENEKVFTFLGSKEVVDRDGDVLVLDNLDLKNFIKNPIALWAHDSRSTPIGKVVGILHDTVNKELYFDIVFAPTVRGKELQTLTEGGFLRATSLGFMVTDYDYDSDTGAFLLTESELLEISLCSIPANQEAVSDNSVKQYVENAQKTLKDKSSELSTSELTGILTEIRDALRELRNPTEVEVTATETDQDPALDKDTDPEKDEKEDEVPVPEEVKEEDPKGAEEPKDVDPESDKSEVDKLKDEIQELREILESQGKQEDQPGEDPDPNSVEDVTETDTEEGKGESTEEDPGGEEAVIYIIDGESENTN